ncbi:MAG: hypothetical protein ACTHKG_19650, partial [Nocardioides sp.]
MPWRDAGAPVRMQRVALVAPAAGLRDLLVRVADAGVVEIDRTSSEHAAGGADVRLSVTPPEPGELERSGRADLAAGEAELATYAADAVVHQDVAALAGWVPVTELAGLQEGLAGVGAAAVPLRAPRGVDPPTLLDRRTEVRR